MWQIDCGGGGQEAGGGNLGVTRVQGMGSGKFRPSCFPPPPPLPPFPLYITLSYFFQTMQSGMKSNNIILLQFSVHVWLIKKCFIVYSVCGFCFPVFISRFQITCFRVVQVPPPPPPPPKQENKSNNRKHSACRWHWLFFHYSDNRRMPWCSAQFNLSPGKVCTNKYVSLLSVHYTTCTCSSYCI